MLERKRRNAEPSSAFEMGFLIPSLPLRGTETKSRRQRTLNGGFITTPETATD